MSKIDSVLIALKSGEELTAGQITARFGARNPHEIVRALRERGHAVYLNERTNSKGETSMKYRLGTPSRAMVAAAYTVLGTTAFSQAA